MLLLSCFTSGRHRKWCLPGMAQGHPGPCGPTPTCHPDGWQGQCLLSSETHLWCRGPPAGTLFLLPSNFLNQDYLLRKTTRVVLRSSEVEILAKFSSMSLLSPFCHLENRMEMLLPNFLAYSKKERLGQMIKHVYFFLCLFKMPEFSLVTKYSQCAMLLSQYRDRKYSSVGMFTMCTGWSMQLSKLWGESKSFKIQNIYPFTGMMHSEMSF